MKIAVASSGLGHVARGIESWAADLGKALAERGESVVLCKGGGNAEAPHERVVPCWQRESDRAKGLARRLSKRGAWRLGLESAYGIEQSTFAWNLLGILRRERIDLLHVQDPQVALIAERARRAGLVRTRTILAHGTEESAGFLEKLPYVQQLAPWHLDEARAAGFARPSWTAIPNFIDTERFRPGRTQAIRAELGIDPGALVVMTAAAIKRDHKRIDYLIDEFARLIDERPELPAVLIVAGGWEADTDELAAEGRARLGDRVRFLVRFPRQRMPELYRSADAFVLCSLKEMMPIALLEATASGLPCLVNRHPVVEWMVGAGGAAVAMADSGALAKALGDWLGEPSRMTALGQQGRRHCEEQFSRDRVVDRILEYYREVLGSGQPSVMNQELEAASI